MGDLAIAAEGLVERFGRVTALAGVDVHVPRAVSGRAHRHPLWQALAWIGGLLAVSVPAAVLCYRRATTA